jgi:hypothetical protein
MLLSVSNTKLIKNKLRTASFGLQAVKTCPGAGDCKSDCFALAGNYVFKNVKAKQQERFLASKLSNFVDVITTEIRSLNVGAVRIHDSGDYYSRKYLAKWIDIANKNPDVILYSYTKSINFFKSDYNTWAIDIPKNMIVTFSYGGRYDKLINPKTDKHALVFQSLEQLLEYNYKNNSVTDDLAYDKETIRVGLIAKNYRKKIGFESTFNKIKNNI